MARQVKRYIYTAVIFILLLLIITTGGGAFVERTAAFAASSKVVEAYEAQNVWEDIQGAKVDGEEIDLKIYNFDEKKSVQIISFVEFGYSYRAELQSDYGLYVYVYNPCGFNFTKNEQLNKIQFRYSGKTTSHFEKYSLKYLNRSAQAGYEGLFYKFKIILSEDQKKTILSTLNSSAREYEVSGIELYDSGVNATEYKISNTYTYSGYAKGYGSASATEDSLNCKCEGFDVSLTLDVTPIQYRPVGTHGNEYTQDILYSVYFSIPNEILKKYGGLSAVHAQWLPVTTKDIWVTGNSDIYQNLDAWRYTVEGGIAGLNAHPAYTLLSKVEEYYEPLIFTGKTLASYKYSHGYNITGIVSDYFNKYLGTNRDNARWGVSPATGLFDTALYYLFYAEGGNADGYRVRSAELLEYIEQYTRDFGLGENPVSGKYNRALFSTVSEEFIDQNILATDKYTLTSEVWNENWWRKTWGLDAWQMVSQSFQNIQAIMPIKTTDFGGTKEENCKHLYIDEEDYDGLKSYFDEATKNDKTVFIFRYYQDKSKRQEVTECRRYSGVGNPDADGDEWDYVKKIDTNAYWAKEVLTLDFDVIDVTCRKGNVNTVIAAVMSPIDIAPDITPPIHTTPEPGESGFNFWQWLLDELRKGTWWVWVIVVIVAVLVLIAIIKILSLAFPIFVPIWKCLWWIVCLPIKGFGALFKKIKQRASERKQRKEFERKARLEQEQQMRLYKHRADLERKENKRQQKLNEKDALKAQKVKDKQTAKRNKKAAKKRRQAAKKRAKSKNKAKGGKRK